MVLTKEGELLLDTDLGAVLMSRPMAFQIINGEKKEVGVSYKILDDVGKYGFELNSGYDPRYELIIDPLIASTFVGGSDFDRLNDIITDSAGNLYIAGYTRSNDYQVNIGSYDASYNGKVD